MTATGQTPDNATELDDLVALAQREDRAGRLAEAADAYRKILALRPDIAEAYNNLGNVLLNQGKLAEAEAAYAQALSLKPGLYQTHNSLGRVFREQGKLDQAVARYQHAIALAPGYAEAHNNLANVLKQQGKFDLALASYERALALRPDFAEALHNLGNTLAQQGKFDEAMARFDQALDLKPDYAEAHYHRADLKTFCAGDPDLARLEALAADSSPLPPGKRLYIHFALAKAFDDVGDYPRAFEHLLQGNALKRREVQYDEAAYQRTFRVFAELFDASLLDRFAGAGDPSPTPIFIVGMPRSGSTLIEQILASHPQIHAAGELWNLHRITQAVSDSAGRPLPFPQSVSALDADGFRQLGHAYLASLPSLGVGKTRIADKAPSNFFHIGLIRLILPNARIIHTTRDPMDTCISCFSTLFTHGQPFSYDLAELGATTAHITS